MRLLSIEVVNFRNYENEKILLGPEKNFFIGKNAQGKTNILEAFYLLCLSKSFRTSREKEAIRFTENEFIIKGEFESDSQIRKKVVFLCSKSGKKQLSVNRKRVSRISEFIGDLPVVVSSPEEYDLTNGPPPERRKFVDIMLSQIQKEYINHLIEYQRIIKQKNSILLDWKLTRNINKAVLEPWNDRLIEIGSTIIKYRDQFSKALSLNLGDIYPKLILNDEKLEFFYKPNLEFGNVDFIKDQFKKELSEKFPQEVQRGISLLGPHRDDFIFRINGKNLKKFGSRGQHKTVLISLTIAEYQLIKELSNEKPIILIDDLYSELDEDREFKIIETLENLGQIFITTTSERDNYYKNHLSKYFYVDNGVINEK